MFTRSTLEPKVRKFCSNMIYIFIADSVMSPQYFGKHYAAIANKRDQQIRYLVGLGTEAAMGSNSLDTMRSWIRDEIAKTYKPLYNPKSGREETATPELILYHLSQGNEVNGINWTEGIYGIGSAPKTDFGGGVTINTETGDFYKNGTLVSEDNLLYSYTRGGKRGTASFFDAETGKTYTAKFKSKKGFSAYSVSNKEGSISKVGGGLLGLADNSMWENIYDLLGQIGELVSAIASKLSGVSAESLSPAQLADGWMTDPNEAGTDWATILLVGAGALAVGSMLGKGSKGKKNKREETN